MPVRKLKSMAQELRVSLTIGTIELWWSKAILRMSVLWANNREAWPSTALENALGLCLYYLSFLVKILQKQLCIFVR